MKQAPTPERDQKILQERLSGRTLRDLAEANDLSIEGVRVVAAREGARQLDDLERRLRANAQTGDVEAYVIPSLSGPDFDMALSYLRWSIGELAVRGVQTQIHYRPTPSGVVFGIELADAEGEPHDRPSC